MQIIRGLGNARDLRPCAATIGNFDGVHLGHQAVLRQLADAARARNLRSSALIFEPQPREFFRPGETVRLTTLHEKLTLLRGQPLDQVMVLRFDAGLAAMEADTFVTQVLLGALQARHLVIGDDFRFGHGRRGDFALLAERGRALGFTVAATETFSLDGGRVSSTGVREALARGDLAMARAMLGRDYAMSGRVVRGAQRGRTLGAPTANIGLGARGLPLSGVFAVSVLGAGARPWPGVANVGVRPTVDGQRPSLEVHLLDGFSGDLYGRRLTVCFRHQLREERRFASLEALKEQIGHDIVHARSWFAAQHPGPGREHGERKRL